jgi:hypothetical protein
MVLVSAVANAEVVEIPLPSLQGDYSVGGVASRAVAFQLDRPPSAVHGASIRWRGNIVHGELVCGPEARPWAASFIASMHDGPLNFWMASAPATAGSTSFDTASAFRPLFGATWGFLMDGSGHLLVEFAPYRIVGLCTFGEPPVGAIENAVLAIEAEFPAPVERGTWGNLKALFSSR